MKNQTDYPKRRKILFANIPGHGHFNPLTGLAIHLQNQGHDIRWYAGSIHHEKLLELGIQYYPFKVARDIDPARLGELFPERVKIKNEIKKLNFDLVNIFILRAPEFYRDIEEIYNSFPFDIMICDISFTGLPFVKEKIGVPVLSVGIVPIMQTSKDLPPYGLAISPSYTLAGKVKQNFLRFLANKMLLSKAHNSYRKILKNYGIESTKNLFDTAYDKSTFVLQNGTPGFEYWRSDLGKNIRYMGPLFPAAKDLQSEFIFDERLKKFNKVILVTQGTVERDVNKIIIPVLEAFKDSSYLVIATTGGTQTRELRRRFQYNNIIIEDFIPFNSIMPFCDVYISNGGYGGVMYSILNKLPMVVAGVHEGKNEINARIGHFKLGVNLQTENPVPAQIKKAVQKVLIGEEYKINVTRLSDEFSQYNPGLLCERYLEEALRNFSFGDWETSRGTFQSAVNS